MRRILRKIAHGDEDLGDTSTMADPTIIKELQSNYNLLVKKK